MKKLFLLGILGLAVVWIVGFFVYRVIMALVEVYDDWQLAKEVREIEADVAARRRQQKASVSSPPPGTPSLEHDEPLAAPDPSESG